MSDVAIVHLGRAGARGEVRRVASWCSIIERSGLSVTAVPVVRRRVPDLATVTAIVSGRAVPEIAAWSRGRLLTTLTDVDPRVVLVVSLRAYRPDLAAGPWHTVLDLVDPLERSYDDRARLVGALRGVGYRALARSHRRVATRVRRSGIALVTAGWGDARELAVPWIPITVAEPVSRPDAPDPDHDVLFVGTLRYPPNIAAVQRLARLWPHVLARRPGTSLIVAGADPPASLRSLCATNRWTLLADFADIGAIARRARVAVAPLDYTAGIQIKVLDAAALGMPQVVTPAALRGLAPDFPLAPSATDEEIVTDLVAVLDDPITARADAELARTAVLEQYGIDRWVQPARQLLEI